MIVIRKQVGMTKSKAKPTTSTAEANEVEISVTSDNQKTNRISVKEYDFLSQDEPIRGQSFVCLSFLSPEDVMKNKEVYVFSEFLKHFKQDVGILFEKLEEKLCDNEDAVNMLSAVKDRYDYIFAKDSHASLQEQFEMFQRVNNQQLTDQFSKMNDFRTNVRGIKVRGAYDTQLEAIQRTKYLKKVDPKSPDIYVAQMGCWCPWSPYPEDMKDCEYAETELNTMMKKYEENNDKKDQHYHERKAELMDKMRKENAKRLDAIAEIVPDDASTSEVEVQTSLPIQTISVEPVSVEPNVEKLKSNRASKNASSATKRKTKKTE